MECLSCSVWILGLLSNVSTSLPYNTLALLSQGTPSCIFSSCHYHSLIVSCLIGLTRFLPFILKTVPMFGIASTGSQHSVLSFSQSTPYAHLRTLRSNSILNFMRLFRAYAFDSRRISFQFLKYSRYPTWSADECSFYFAPMPPLHDILSFCPLVALFSFHKRAGCHYLLTDSLVCSVQLCHR